MALALQMKAFLLYGVVVIVTSQATDEDLKRLAKLSFQSQDQNKDGLLTLTEALADFDNHDTNKDGMWTLREYSRLPKGTPIPNDVKKRFNYYDKLDGDRDGKAQRSQVEPFFRKMDKNGDGNVTEDELADLFLGNLCKLCKTDLDRE